MKANPGGYIPPSDVIGRDALIQRLWRILERQSLVLTAERRMGKTCVINKMMVGVPKGQLAIPNRDAPKDLEQVHTSVEFVETVFQDVEDYLSVLRRTAEQARRFLTQLSGAEFKGFKFPNIVTPHWKILLTKTIEDLVEYQDRTVIFFWDEMPLMLYNIKQREGEGAAMEVLDTLRSLRQMHPGLRMVFTGSIGLHQVISSLKRSGYANDPTNDMLTEDVPPLSPNDAQELARRLLEGEGISTSNLQATVRAIADVVDRIPHYIHHVVDQLKNRGGMVDEAIVGEVVDTCLTDPLDRWHMRHYQERIDTYYTPEERPFALGLLDILSITRRPLAFDDLFNLLKSRIVTEDSEMVRHMITLLQRDHYIVQQMNGTYHFRFSMIQRSWRLQRGLSS
ncbi:MAG: ATP-binding protein [Candidatus Tectomicrobia bacterium]|nr:ATP-binding protein [Candidatus Tectomicrobia bacterium]